MASVLMALCGKKRSLTCSGKEVRATQLWEHLQSSHSEYEYEYLLSMSTIAWCRKEGGGNSKPARNLDLRNSIYLPGLQFPLR